MHGARVKPSELRCVARERRVLSVLGKAGLQPSPGSLEAHLCQVGPRHVATSPAWHFEYLINGARILGEKG